MKLLIRLYPRAWRERYGPEFEALLHDEGVTIGRALDIARAGLLLRWHGWSVGASRDLSNASEVFRGFRPLQKFAVAMALLGAFNGARKAGDIVAGVALPGFVASVVALNLIAQTRDDRGGSRARRSLAVLLFVSLSVDALIYVASYGSARSTMSKWVMQPVVLAIIPQVRPWPRPDRLWALRLGTLFCGLQIAGFGIGTTNGQFGVTQGVICGLISISLAFLLERERRALIQSAPLP